MALALLPPELLLSTAGYLAEQADLNNLARINIRLYCNLNGTLYSRNSIYQSSSALTWAAKNGRVRTAELALANGANLDFTSPIYIPGLYGSEVRWVGIYVNLLHSALCYQRPEIALFFLMQDHNLSEYQAGPPNCRSSFHLAAAMKLVRAVKELVSDGVDPTIFDTQRRAPWHYVVIERGKIDWFEIGRTIMWLYATTGVKMYLGTIEQARIRFYSYTIVGWEQKAGSLREDDPQEMN